LTWWFQCPSRHRPSDWEGFKP